jgi:hypothetical protein
MKHEQIDDKARAWIVTRGIDGRLLDEFDPGLFARLNPDDSAESIAETLVIAAGEMDVDETRAW